MKNARVNDESVSVRALIKLAVGESINSLIKLERERKKKDGGI